MTIAAHTIVGSSDGPHLVVLAGIHGDELEPMVAVQRLARRLRRHSLRGRFTLIPTANPSARLLRQRVGADGLDLARTFPGRWEGSVTERVAAELNEWIHSADYLIDLHTGGGNYRLWPLAGYMVHETPAVLRRQRQMARAFNLPVVWGSDPGLQGRSLSAARDAGVPAIYVEYLGTTTFCRTAVHAMIEGCLNVAARMRMLEGRSWESCVRFWAEDARTGSGHLQASHPAPTAGTFEPEVELGQPVVVGQRLGELLGESIPQPFQIVSQNSGRVVCLRTRRPAIAGEGLAVVVPFSEESPVDVA